MIGQISEMIDFFASSCNFFITFLAFLRDMLLETPLLAFLGPFIIIAVIKQFSENRNDNSDNNERP